MAPAGFDPARIGRPDRGRVHICAVPPRRVTRERSPTRPAHRRDRRGRLRVQVGQVLAERAGEDVRLLGDEDAVTGQGRLADSMLRNTAEPDLTRPRRERTGDQSGKCGFAGPGCSRRTDSPRSLHHGILTFSHPGCRAPDGVSRPGHAIALHCRVRAVASAERDGHQQIAMLFVVVAEQHAQVATAAGGSPTFVGLHALHLQKCHLFTS